MTPDVKARVLAAAASLQLRAGELRPGFAARAAAREARRQTERPATAAPRIVAG